MKREIITTADGSKTIKLASLNEQYHSIHGAIQEATHVFIEKGFNNFLNTKKPLEQPISILEIGFGTGLNALITLLESVKNKRAVFYTGVEAYPVKQTEIQQLNYPDLLKETNTKTYFKTIHESVWEKPTQITETFTLIKQQKLFQDISGIACYDVIYFDAFGPRVQPELWEEPIFKNMYQSLKPGGMLVTYSAKGSVRRTMQSVGFLVERLPGPPGKREMLRATKQNT